MNFEQTGLPDRQVFRDAFQSGWPEYSLRSNKGQVLAAHAYLRGPVAMAKLICEHADENCDLAAAACLAGPAAFARTPCAELPPELTAFCMEVKALNIFCAKTLADTIPRLSSNARLFLQASAIMLLEQLADDVDDNRQENSDTYTTAFDIYSAARGMTDSFKLDTRLEIAAMKASMTLADRPYIWVRPTTIQVPEQAYLRA